MRKLPSNIKTERLGFRYQAFLLAKYRLEWHHEQVHVLAILIVHIGDKLWCAAEDTIWLWRDGRLNCRYLLQLLQQLHIQRTVNKRETIKTVYFNCEIIRIQAWVHNKQLNINAIQTVWRWNHHVNNVLKSKFAGGFHKAISKRDFTKYMTGIWQLPYITSHFFTINKSRSFARKSLLFFHKLRFSDRQKHHIRQQPTRSYHYP